MNLSPSSSSSRWSPTPEQLMMLEEIYRGGVRTPSASQIQRITAQLSLYGRIEGKNVFYWFQNHKARDRQKLRRKLLLTQQLIHQHHHHQQPYHPAAPNYNQHFLPSSPAVRRRHDHLQVGGSVNVVDHTSTRSGMNCKWKSTLMDNNSSSLIINKTWNGDYWKTIMTDVCAISPAAAPPHDRPLKTLQLFPVTSSTSTVAASDRSVVSSFKPY